MASETVMETVMEAVMETVMEAAETSKTIKTATTIEASKTS